MRKKENGKRTGRKPGLRWKIRSSHILQSFSKRAKKQKPTRFWKLARGGLLVFLLCVGMLCVSVCAVSGAVKHKSAPRVLSLEELSREDEGFDCVLILGCRVYENGRMSDMLTDRVLTGIEIFESGACDTLLMSGDHRTDAYDEPSAMKAFAVKKGVPSERIFLDHDGYSTYDSLARYKEIYGGGRVVIVTQEYHLYRALYLAEKLGIDAVGVSADLRTYRGQSKRDAREMLARCKDVYLGLKQPLPEVLGEKVSLSGNGDATAQTRPSLS